MSLFLRQWGNDKSPTCSLSYHLCEQIAVMCKAILMPFWELCDSRLYLSLAEDVRLRLLFAYSTFFMRLGN